MTKMLLSDLKGKRMNTLEKMLLENGIIINKYEEWGYINFIQYTDWDYKTDECKRVIHKVYTNQNKRQWILEVLTK